MSRENLIWMVLLLVGAGLLAARGMVGEGFGKAYYELKPDTTTVDVPMNAGKERVKAQGEAVAASQPAAGNVYYSGWRTFGIWLSAFFTLAILSFLYRDNPFYKFAEHAFVGISAAYYMVIAVWTTLIPNLFGKLFPRFVKSVFQPGLDLDSIIEKHADETLFAPFRVIFQYDSVPYDYAAGQYDGLAASWLQLMNPYYLVPVALGVMLLWRLAPKGQWISRWSLAFILGYTSGLRLVGFLGADFVRQIAPTIEPLAVMVTQPDGQVLLWQSFYASLNNIIILVGVVTGLTYFFFSVEHRGFIGRVSRVGIWVLMITFGAGFGYTVMGRIALLVGRFEYLVSNWLNIVPPA